MGQYHHRRAGDSGEPGRGSNSGSLDTKKWHKHRVPAAIILIRPVPDNIALFQAMQDAADILTLNGAGKIFHSATGHNRFQHGIFIGPVHDIHINITAQCSAAEVQRRQVHAQQQHAFATGDSLLQVFKAVHRASLPQSRRIPDPNPGSFNQADADGAQVAAYQLLLLLGIQFGKTQADIGCDNVPAAPGKPVSQCTCTGTNADLQAVG